MSIVLDGSNLTTTGVINSGTVQNSTSGTSIDFTGIPSGTKRITVMLNGVALNASSNLLIQLGTASSVEATSYVSTSSLAGSGNALTVVSSTTGFLGYLSNSAFALGGSMTITNISGNIWVGSGVFANTSSIPYGNYVAGTKSLGGVLTRVRLTTVNGTDTFTAGSVNILYE